jgi:dihydrofolate synthase/folylpolyglutamate synthase
LYGLEKFGMKLGLENSRSLCRLLGHPERSFIPVLVAGTNGKGSVAAMLEAILRRAGLRVGLYTSPHLVRPEERIRIDGADIEPEAFTAVLRRLRDLVERHAGSAEMPGHPTFFEVMTAACFAEFARARLDVGVLEVGLGGRLDSTNISEPVLSIVTGVDVDHVAQLGGDLLSIAREKAGVWRSGRPALIGEKKAVPRAELERLACEAGSIVVHVPSEARVAVLDDGLAHGAGEGGTLLLHLETPAGTYGGLRVPLPGEHQAGNVAIAARAAEILSHGLGSLPPFRLSGELLREGLAATRWPGRLQWIEGAPPLLLDCAHNPAGCAALAGALRRVGPGRVVLLFGAMSDKDIPGMARELHTSARAVVATRSRIDRAAPAGRVLDAFREVSPDLPCSATEPAPRALDEARSLAGPEGVVCVAGSIFLVGEIIELLEARGG